jgi:SNF2 family DNA or RNA helicase
MLTLRAHQQTPVNLARTHKNLALFMEAGTGKTGTIARILAEDFNSHKRFRKVLIFAPLTVCAQWPVEIAKFTKIPQDRIHVLTDAGAKRTKRLSQIIELGKASIIVTNYESVQIKDFYNLLLRYSPEIVVCDESHRLKDSQAKRSKAIYPLCFAADRRFLLTGTPAPNSLLDLFGQYKALDTTVFGGGFFNFRSRYFYDRNAGRQFSFPDWRPHPWAEKEIGEKLKESCFQVTREECLDLPPLSLIPVPCDMSAPQKKAYEEMKKEFVTELQGMVMSSEFEMVKTLRMQQILAGFIQPDEAENPLWFKDVPRLDALLENIEAIGNKKQIIWTVFRPTYQKISEELTKRGITHTFLTGEQTTDAQKQANKQRFTHGDAQILIANPAAAGEGIDGLQIAQYAHFYMRGWSLLHYLQALARNYRGGSEQHDKVIHYHYYVKGTLDEVLAHALIYKENVQEKVLEWAKTGISLALDKGIVQEGMQQKETVWT